MLRLAILSLSVSIGALSGTPSKAGGLTFSTEKPPFTTTVVPGNSFYAPTQQWSDAPRDPAIAKTLRPNDYFQPDQSAHEEPIYETQPVEQWSNPTYPGSRFSYPQQGFYPREGYQPQHPGYEYDFEQGNGYGSQYPMEGASWRESTPAFRATGLSQPPQQTVPAQTYLQAPYAPCPTY